MNTTRQQTCLTDEILQKLSQGTLQPMDLSRVEEHVGECELCRDLLDSLASDEQWQDEFLPVLRKTDVEKVSPGDLEDPARDEPSIETVLKLLGPSDDPHKLGRIGTYEVIGVIGRGGMGVVFKALDPALNRFVAIKMLLPHLAASGAARKRFAREGKAAAAVIDDHVMPIHCVSEWQGIPYLVTQYSRGVTLQKRIQDQGPLELKEILRIGMQIARGLAAAHAQGLVHRDVKPSNILLDGTVERCLLTDFGLARAVDDASITRTGIIAGTPQYMSPEQASGGMVDTRSDLFGLGSVLYAMCTGRPPFRADNSFAVLRLITDKEPTPIQEINPDVPPWLSAIVTRLMAKKPEDRFESASEVATLLEKCLAHVQQPTSVPLPSVPEYVVVADRPITLPRKVSIGKRGMVLLGIMLFGAAAILFGQTEPPDIAGDWTGPEWGQVHLKAIQPGQYEGTFSDTVSREPGTITLKWSRIERRYNGTWNEGKGDRFGEISLRAGGATITGAYSTNRLSRVNPETPKLADLTWSRGKGEQTRMTGNQQAKGHFADPGARGVEPCLKCHAPQSFSGGSFGSGKEFWHGDHWSMPGGFPGSSGDQPKELNSLIHSLIGELNQIMGLSLGLSINASGDPTIRFDPKYGSQANALAESLGPVLNHPGIGATDSRKKKHLENCLVLIIELKKFTQIQIKNHLLERLRNKQITQEQVNQLEFSRLPETASQMAKKNLELWKQLDSVEVPPSKDSPERAKKLKEIHTFLTVFFIDPRIVDPIIAKGSSEWQFSFPQLDGRQRLVSLFMALKEGTDHELGDLHALKARWGARLEILETLELLLKKELQSQKSATGKSMEGAGSSSDPELGGSIPISPKAPVENLEGVWEVQLPPEIIKTVPEGQRTRLVILKSLEKPAPGKAPIWWHSTFQGSKQLSASPLVLDEKNHRLSFNGQENQTMHGIYEVKGDGLRLSIAPITEPLPTRFGTLQPEFKRVQGNLAEEQVAELRRTIQKEKEKNPGKSSAEQRPDLSGQWIDLANKEFSYSISVGNPARTEILIEMPNSIKVNLHWSEASQRYEGTGVLTGGEKYQIAVQGIPDENKIAVTWFYDPAWKEKWFKQRVPRYPEISSELRNTLQKEFEEQNHRTWIREKTSKPPAPELPVAPGPKGKP